MISWLAYILFLLVAIAAGTFGVFVRLRRLRVRAAVQTLASIVSQNLPLVGALQAAAQSERPTLARIYRGLAGHLEAGAQLSTALRATFGHCPGEIVGAVQAAERGGTLPGVLQALASEGRQEAREPRLARIPLWYPFTLALLAPLVLAFILVQIVPKFHEIFRDFETELPAVTVSLVRLGVWAQAYAPLVTLAVVALLVLVAYLLVGRHFAVRVPDRFQPLCAAWDTLLWILPGLRQATRNKGLARQLPIMQAAVKAGHDLAEAARQGACVAANIHTRRRLHRWAAALQQGADPRGSARQLGFPAPFLRALAGPGTALELSTRLEYLALYYRGLYLHWRQLATAITAPLLVMLWAACTAYIALALILPLLCLINSVSGTVF